MIIVSACLLGLQCKYDGKDNADPEIIDLAKVTIMMPVCPEQLGGLPTPREPAQQIEDKIFTISGKDVTDKFQRGAEQVLKIAKLFDIKKAFLKQGSPSCGCGKIPNGFFDGKTIEGDGVTAAFLKANGIRVIAK